MGSLDLNTLLGLLQLGSSGGDGGATGGLGGLLGGLLG